MTELNTTYEQVTLLQNLLVDAATGGVALPNDYEILRKNLIHNNDIKHLLPAWIKTNRNLSQFWNFIKYKFPSYKERRDFIWNEFQPLLDILETEENHPSKESIEVTFNKFDASNIKTAWGKCLERSSDPEGAITMVRTLLESVCKYILDKEQVPYSNNIDMSELYKLTTELLNMAPEQHTEKVFKQILGGCSGVVNGLGNLRNKHGDAHGKGVVNVKPKPRHAELAVNLAGSMALFLLSTYQELN